MTLRIAVTAEEPEITAGLTVFMGAETYGILLEREHIPIIVLVCSTFPGGL